MPAQTINLDTPPPETDIPPTPGNSETTDSSAGPSTAPPRTADIKKLEKQLHDFHAQLGTYMGMMMPDGFAGAAIASAAEPASSAWADLAAQDPAVKAALKKFLTGGVWANLVGVYAAGIALPILAYYGKLPERAQGMILYMTAESNPMLGALIAQKYSGGGE